MKKLLITFEGIDGSGKSTQAKRLETFLKERGYSVSLYREPGGTHLAEKIREIILSFDMSPLVELLLFESARASLMLERVLQDLERGKVVILDRFTDSTLVYQGVRCVDRDLIKTLNVITTKGIKPDITFLLDLPVEEAIKRKEDTKSKFESVDLLKRIRESYLALAYEEKERVHTIDASKSEEEVFEEIVSKLWQKLL
ncbi:MAG: dTMP kinase [Aquificaceae bacterium]